MHIRRFQTENDLPRLEAYLRDRYFEHHTAVSWLPERLHDVLYRVGAQERDEGRERSGDFIFLWEEAGDIVGCLLPDGENIYVSIREGFERLFPSMLAFGEENCLPLFDEAEDGTVKFWVAVSDGLPRARETLTASGYGKYAEEEYANCVDPFKADASAELPDGFRLLYGEEYPEEDKKWSALRLGFHPELEAPGYRAGMGPYNGRKGSSLYPDSFECLIVDETTAEDNNVCAYCFVYVDRQTKTALIEPVSTREKYRHRGLGIAMMYGAIRRCRELGLEKCYVNSFGRRKDFYAASGFFPESSVGFWYKELMLFSKDMTHSTKRNRDKGREREK